MIGNRNAHIAGFNRRGEDAVRSAVARGAYDGEKLKAAQRWLERCELERQRRYEAENKQANIVLAGATAMGALILSIAAMA